MGRPTPLKVNGANFSTLLPPRGATLYHFEVWSYRACQPLQMSPPPCLYDTVIQSYVQLKSGSIEDGPFHGPSYTIESQWGKF